LPRRPEPRPKSMARYLVARGNGERQEGGIGREGLDLGARGRRKKSRYRGGE
jgi:hypothetical protein